MRLYKKSKGEVDRQRQQLPKVVNKWYVEKNDNIQVYVWHIGWKIQGSVSNLLVWMRGKNFNNSTTAFSTNKPCFPLTICFINKSIWEQIWQSDCPLLFLQNTSTNSQTKCTLCTLHRLSTYMTWETWRKKELAKDGWEAMSADYQSSMIIRSRTHTHTHTHTHIG